MADPLGAVRYVALGDSYTIGTAVAPSERWPDRLVVALGQAPGRLELVANLAVDGSTSRDVLDGQVPKLASLEPDLVSLLVGVNDVVQGVPPATYRATVSAILEALAGLVGRAGVLLVTTPDYTVTPAGSDYGDPIERSAGIRAVNAALARLAAEWGIALADIHDLSLEAGRDPLSVAADGLHPSGRQYARWVDERILPVADRLLRDRSSAPGRGVGRQGA